MICHTQRGKFCRTASSRRRRCRPMSPLSRYGIPAIGCPTKCRHFWRNAASNGHQLQIPPELWHVPLKFPHLAPIPPNMWPLTFDLLPSCIRSKKGVTLQLSSVVIFPGRSRHQNGTVINLSPLCQLFTSIPANNFVLSQSSPPIARVSSHTRWRRIHLTPKRRRYASRIFHRPK